MIEKKRCQLVGFIREQTIGPGATGSRFLDLKDQDAFPLESRSPLLYHAELINTVPAGIYSTGILFPVDKSKQDRPVSAAEEKEDPKNKEDVDQPVDNVPGEEEADVDEEVDINVDVQSLNQMYPNTMGLSVCLSKDIINDNDLEITISGRYYTKVKVKEEPGAIGVLLELEPAILKDFLSALQADDVVRTSIDIGITPKQVQYLYFKGDLNHILDIQKRIYEIKREQYNVLKAGEEREYMSLDGLREALFNKLRRDHDPSSVEGNRIIEKLKRIEAIESCLAHIQDVVTIFDSTGYGIWKSRTFEERVGEGVTIPANLKGKHIYAHKDQPALGNIQRQEYASGKWASLGINLQFSRHSNKKVLDDRIFLKVQLQNTSKPFEYDDTNNGKNYFSVASEEINKRCFFGVGIQVRSRHLVPYRPMVTEVKEKYSEEEVNRYIYRQYQDFAVGHGCSVKWDKQEGGMSVSTEYIPTHDTPDVDPIPRDKYAPFEHGDTEYTPKAIFTDTAVLQFKWLSTLSSISDQEIITRLRAFVGAYGKWINDQKDPDNPEISAQIRGLCQKDQTRMLSNIDMLLNDKEHLSCFRLMNTAMFMQMWHSVKVKENEMNSFIMADGFNGFFEDFYKVHADDRLSTKKEHAAWRPFQLAFILLNLDGIFQRSDDTEWAARNEWVDLVWFPTGGGKTEAYFGLIALTIINRRRTLRERGGGTAVIMRYTLRLLTQQQFKRASLLIMALEIIRRWGTYDLGKEPIYIGLYVGAGSLPNALRGDGSSSDTSLLKEYNKLLEAQNNGRSTQTKIPVQECPWCGHKMDPIKFYDITASTDLFTSNRILLGCSRPDHKCAFHVSSPLPSRRKDQGPMPLGLCDEEIYQHPPALLFGTVDKFAQLAHKVATAANDKGRTADSRRLFGTGNWEPGKPPNGYAPPDLIIQDELHLMTGPLGSAVALFESAIDQLCSTAVNGKQVRPKVISSTATTRNTPLQIMALFDRRVNLFPKPGIHCDDSFFAFYKRAAEDEHGNKEHYISKRRYMGILPTGRTQMWMQLRLAAILFTHRAIFEAQEIGARYPVNDNAFTSELIKAMDHYHTILTYFNSLREVGRTESQLYSYLIKETRRVFNKVMRPGKLMHCFYTYSSCFKNGELTGRLSGEKIVAEMAKISAPWKPDQRLSSMPPDIVIATNMISVGIDISRFNSMIINCMPRNIAEYIQASSRVARDTPGLVITVHHPFRSRDISHYERFIEFHEKMYSYVEPISITPFTKKALERYLPLYIATMLRHKEGFADRTDAHTNITEKQKNSLVEGMLQYFKQRTVHLWKMDDIERTIKELLTDKNVEDIEQLITEAIDAWQEEYNRSVDENARLVFNSKALHAQVQQRQLYVNIDEYQDNIGSELWRIPQSLRVVDPEAVIHVRPK